MHNVIKKSIQKWVNTEPEQPAILNTSTSEKEKFTSAIKSIFQKDLNQGYVVKSTFTFKTAEGTPIYWKVRLEHTNAPKIIRPIKKQNGNYIVGEPNFDGKKPLYQQELLKHNSDTVFIVEGENKALILKTLGVLAVTSGSATSATSADWSPLEGRKVIIWQDNDQPGKDFAKNSADILLELGCHVMFVDIDKLNLNISEDVIDWLERNPNATKEDIRSLPLISYEEIHTGNQIQASNADTSNGWKVPMSITTIPKRRPYPVDALPESILRPVQEAVDFIQCPFPMAACAAIANISIVSQCLVNVERDNGLNGPASLYFLIVADSGERKSSIDNRFSLPVRNWDKAKAEENRNESKEYAILNSLWKIKEDQIKKAIISGIRNGKDTSAHEALLQKHMFQEPKKPISKSLIYKDATTEALSSDLAFNLPFGGVFSSEGGSVLGGAGMKNDAAMGYLSFLNIIWDGDSYPVLRKTSESFTLNDARLSISLAIQHETLNSFLSSQGKLARGTGFLARFLMTRPESTQGSRMYKKAPKNWTELELYYNRINDLLGLIDADKPFNMLKMCNAAQALWIESFNKFESQLAQGGDFIDIKDIASKAADNVARLAAVFHVFEYGPEGEINPDHVEKASRIVEWHLYESRSYFSDANNTEQTNELDLLKNWLVNESGKNGAKSVRYSTALQSGPNPLRKKEALAKALDGLVNANIVRITRSEGTKYIELNPALLYQEATNDDHY